VEAVWVGVLVVVLRVWVDWIGRTILKDRGKTDEGVSEGVLSDT
jgi:hypothetical protein